MGIEELRERVAGHDDQPVWARLLIESQPRPDPDDEDRKIWAWVLRYGYLWFGERPADWLGESWNYERTRFLAIELEPREALELFGSTDEHGVDIAGDPFLVPASIDAEIRRRPGFETYDPYSHPQPTFEYSRSPQNSASGWEQSGFLVGSTSPTFVNRVAAFRAFFFDSFDHDDNRSVPNGLLEVRVPDLRGWIGPVHVRASEVSVDVGGTDCADTSLEYFSPNYRSQLDVGEPGVVTISVPEGVDSSNTWIYLKTGTEWLDYRTLAGPWASDSQLERAGVERDFVSRDAQAAWEAVIFAGEGPVTEFKRDFPEGGTNKTATVFKTIAAFANGSGGTVIFGMDPDETTVVGIDGHGGLAARRDQLGQMIHSRVLPTPGFHIQSLVIDGKDLLVLEVWPSPTPPYGVIPSKDKRDKPEYFVRRGASTYPAQPSDLHEIVQRAIGASLIQVPRFG